MTVVRLHGYIFITIPKFDKWNTASAETSADLLTSTLIVRPLLAQREVMTSSLEGTTTKVPHLQIIFCGGWLGVTSSSLTVKVHNFLRWLVLRHPHKLRSSRQIITYHVASGTRCVCRKTIRVLGRCNASELIFTPTLQIEKCAHLNHSIFSQHGNHGRHPPRPLTPPMVLRRPFRHDRPLPPQ